MLGSEGFLGLALLAAVTLTVLIILLVVTVRAAHGQLGRNRLAGIRTRATMHSDAAWVAAHQAALPVTKNALAAFVCGVLGGSFVSLFLPPAVAIGSSILIGAVSALILVVVGGARGNRAALATNDTVTTSDSITPS